MNARELFNKAKELMAPEEIDSQHELGSDLYLKVTPTSKVLIEQYEFKGNVTTFKDNIDHELWYDIPFANMAWWDEKFTSQQ
jgi:hypothetical protein